MELVLQVVSDVGWRQSVLARMRVLEQEWPCSRNGYRYGTISQMADDV